MPKYRYIALATASLMVLSAPAGAAYAASAHRAPEAGAHDREEGRARGQEGREC